MRTVMGLALLLQGCVIVRHEAVDDMSFSEDFDRVVVDLEGGGDLSVRLGDGEARLTRTWRWTGPEPDVHAFVEAGVLHLEVDCRDTQLSCQVDHELVVPRSVSLSAEMGAGDVDASDLVDDIHVDTGSGDIDLVRIDGDLDLSTGSGDVTVRDAGCRIVTSSTGAGDMDLELHTVPDHVLLDSGAGDIRLVVPHGSYRVDADTGAGDLRIDGITVDQSADATIDITTGAGDIDLIGR
ncbi:MAG: DUF4097 family beta strand repeat protein [Alphaproteobacteria bacterium]|nr:DUF4097 family beta strand repeat protein [Alphaproteobacteria bacterium]